jgi:hypothetical protein
MLVKPTGARSWLLRVQQEGKRRAIGLGSVQVKTRIGAELVEDASILHRRVLTLGEARDKASLFRKFAKAGRDPIRERDKDRGWVPTFRKR